MSELKNYPKVVQSDMAATCQAWADMVKQTAAERYGPAVVTLTDLAKWYRFARHTTHDGVLTCALKAWALYQNKHRAPSADDLAALAWDHILDESLNLREPYATLMKKGAEKWVN